MTVAVGVGVLVGVLVTVGDGVVVEDGVGVLLGVAVWVIDGVTVGLGPNKEPAPQDVRSSNIDELRKMLKIPKKRFPI